MRGLFLALGMTAALSGCGSLNYNLAPEKFDVGALQPGSAIVIVSGGAPQHCISAGTTMTIAPAGSGFAKNGIVGINVDSYVYKSDFTDHFGNLSVFQIKPGRYELYPYVLNPYLSQTKIPKAEFSAESGDVLYIGEFFAPIACGPGETRIEIRDMADRDLDLLRARNHAFSSMHIVKRLATFTGYVGDP